MSTETLRRQRFHRKPYLYDRCRFRDPKRAVAWETGEIADCKQRTQKPGATTATRSSTTGAAEHVPSVCTHRLVHVLFS